MKAKERSVPVHLRVPADFWATVLAESSERHVTYTTVLWERMGILETPKVKSPPKVRNEVTKKVPSIPTVPSSKKHVPEGHVHSWGNRSTVTGLKRCECGALKS